MTVLPAGASVTQSSWIQTLTPLQQRHVDQMIITAAVAGDQDRVAAFQQALPPYHVLQAEVATPIYT